MRLSGTILAIVLAIVLASTGSSSRAEVNGTRYQDWTLACRATAINQTSCVLTQILVQADDNAFLAEIGVSMQPAEEGPRAVLVLRVPTGVMLLSRPAANVDDGPEEDVIELAWQSCDPDFCAATALLSAEDTARLKAGGSARMGYQRLDQPQPTVFNVSLLGITAGMDVLSSALPDR